MNGWRRSGRGARARLTATLEPQEAAVLNNLITEIRELLAGRSAQTPVDEMSVLTGIRTGPNTIPDDRVLARLLPDFTRDDPDLAAGMRSLHEPTLIEAKDNAAAVVQDTLPTTGGKVALTADQADAWLTALNDVRLALGTALDITEEMDDELPQDDPRAAHLGVYHWLTFVQDSLVQARMQVR